MIWCIADARCVSYLDRRDDGNRPGREKRHGPRSVAICVRKIDILPCAFETTSLVPFDRTQSEIKGLVLGFLIVLDP
jgi:hypothetical protein